MSRARASDHWVDSPSSQPLRANAEAPVGGLRRLKHILVASALITELRTTKGQQPKHAGSQMAATLKSMSVWELWFGAGLRSRAQTQIVATGGIAERGSSHRAGFPRIGTRLLAIQCALWLADSSIIPQLHQAFANHRHIYCAVHDQIEDAGPKLDYATLIERPQSERSRIPALQNSLSDFGCHRACQFSSTAVNLSLRMPKVWHVSSGIAPETYWSALHGTDLPTPDILLVAPKQSPPAM